MGGVLRRLLVIFIIMLKAIYAQFVEQADSGTVFVPVQDEVTLTCSVEEGYIVDWCLAFPNGDKAVASSDIAIIFLMQRNISIEGEGTSRSTLLLRETENQTNNGINITCTARETNSDTEEIFGNTAVVFFYDATPSLANLSVTENEQSSINISWSLGFIEGVPVNYTLTVLNLNTTSAQPIIIAGLLDQYYVFEISRPCDVYSFTVTAVTAAGNSTPSQEIIFTRNSSSEVCAATTRETIAQTSTWSKDTRHTTTSADVEVYYIIGATTGTAITTMLVVVLMILYCCCKLQMTRKKGCTNILESQLQVHHPETEYAGNQFYGIYAQVSADIAQDNGSEEVETSTLYAQVGIEQEVVIADDSEEARLNLSYANVDKSKSKESQSAEAMYAVINKCKTESGQSNAACADDTKMDPLYSQVKKSRESKSKGNSFQSKALYAKVDKSKLRQNKDCSEVQEEVNALYAQVDKSKKRNKADSSQLPEVLYAEVNKTKTDNSIAVALYSQVNKSKMKFSMTAPYALVDRSVSRKELGSDDKVEALYAQVNKTKKKVAIEELELQSTIDQSDGGVMDSEIEAASHQQSSPAASYTSAAYITEENAHTQQQEDTL